ncbi:hypothetical protein MGYG_04808 [Nannizzia gypsea CBS 118893]|uniref:Uncharacterized protein n=1 Tax=Arthroderma gypseum (strain ATCC MYA-4604 / CBS 118893) TaxID=535722 RepID=E4UWV4_ARTGP|nr:hypothetical protein MGYG_04808 [Nannizzia gypsea CBS 118893]EFR01807.1 hypothetical protein MGYG_04808 [Nannizzia gypsea CBS 118893]
MDSPAAVDENKDLDGVPGSAFGNMRAYAQITTYIDFLVEVDENEALDGIWGSAFGNLIQVSLSNIQLQPNGDWCGLTLLAQAFDGASGYNLQL